MEHSPARLTSLAEARKQLPLPEAEYGLSWVVVIADTLAWAEARADRHFRAPEFLAPGRALVGSARGGSMKS